MSEIICGCDRQDWSSDEYQSSASGGVYTFIGNCPVCGRGKYKFQPNLIITGSMNIDKYLKFVEEEVKFPYEIYETNSQSVSF
jgi:hypothetical protein